MGLTQYHAYLTEEQLEMLRAIDKRPVAEHIRRAVDLYLSTRAYSIKESMVRYSIEDRPVRESEK